MSFMHVWLTADQEPLETHHPRGDADPALGREFLHVAVVKHEAKGEPDGLADDLGWELVQGGGNRQQGPCPTPT